MNFDERKSLEKAGTLEEFLNMSWNFRVLRHRDPNPLHERKPELSAVHEWLGIHEVYYNEAGEPTTCTIETLNIVADDLEGLEFQVKGFLEALQKPILEYNDF